jgi:aldehyde dehydrogenase (NAD+)
VHADLLTRDRLYIGGEWVAAGSGRSPIEVTDSASGKPLGRVPAGDRRDVDRAVQAAQGAAGLWRRTPPAERAAALDAVREQLTARLADIADVISLPLHQLVGKVGGALAAGCAVVAKPASEAPLAAFALADAIAAAGLPAGVFNLVSGGGSEVGGALAGHRGIDLVSFTGSTQVAALAAPNITRTSLELGGKSASVVLEDADLERAVRTSVGNAFLNSGQTCSAWTRLLVPRARQDQALEIAVAAAQRLRLGHPLDDGTRLGPLVSAAQQRAVREHIERGKTLARLVTGGAEQPADLPDGFYVAPTIFADVDNGSALGQEEIFGPVLSVIPFDTEEEAIAIANDSPYGLAGGVWSTDLDRADAVARLIRTGQVDINGAAFNPVAPFGGVKASGYGREFGELGIEEFTVTKAIQR